MILELLTELFGGKGDCSTDQVSDCVTTQILGTDMTSNMYAIHNKYVSWKCSPCKKKRLYSIARNIGKEQLDPKLLLLFFFSRKQARKGCWGGRG